MRADRYRKFNRLTEEEMLELAVIALDGEALLLFQWEDTRRPVTRWEELKTLLIRQFRSKFTGTLQEQWLALQQTEGVRDYRKKFIEFLAPLKGVPDSLVLSQFINGLKEEIKVKMRAYGPKNVDQAMELAIRVEDEVNYGKGQRNESGSGNWPTRVWAGGTNSQTGGIQVRPAWSGPNTASGGAAQNRPSNLNNNNQSRTGGSSGSVNKPGTEVRRLSPKEIQIRREKGLCFRCDGKWGANHQCGKGELSVLMITTEEEEVAKGAAQDCYFDAPPEGKQEETELEQGTLAHMTLY